MALFHRDDWALFRSLGTLPQRAGVAVQHLPRLVVKELVDNALDAAPEAAAPIVDICADGLLRVRDFGAGIEGTPEEIAALFSIARPLTSSKQMRLLARGALGNGLRVVAGTILATEGTLRVITRGMDLHLEPCENGGTLIKSNVPSAPDEIGTVIEARLGSGYAFKSSDQYWTRFSRCMAGAPSYAGKSSPHWYDEDAFFELCQAYGNRFARDLVAMLDGCANPKAGRIAKAFTNRAADSLSRDEAAVLLAAARDEAKPVAPKRLGFVGAINRGLPPGYARSEGTFQPSSVRGTLRAQLPFVVECWAEIRESGQADKVAFCVNRTSVAAEISPQRQSDKTRVAIFGCGLGHSFKVGRAPVGIVVNVQTPYMPFTSEGKAPDFQAFIKTLSKVIPRATSSAKHKLIFP